MPETTKIVKVTSSDSKLTNQSKLSRFATRLWTKIKTRYDGTFKDVNISDSSSNDKKLTFTKTDNSTQDVDLRDYVRLQDKNDFKQDVSSNVGMVDGTLKLGSINGTLNQKRVSGHRSITTKRFVDGYVSHLTILTDETLEVGIRSSWSVWSVEKKEDRNNDVVRKKYNSEAVVKEINIDGVNYKSVEVSINEKFDNEVYFIVGCDDQSKGYKVINLRQENRNNDVVNVSTRPNVGGNISWEPVTTNVAVILMHGRESIGSLSEKINKVNSDSSLYVKHSETTNAGGTTNADKVVKLDSSGKLNKDMLPSIAINNYFQIAEFTDNGLRNVTYENGDVVVVSNTGKKYLCINKVEGQANSRTDFIELNSKDGSVVSVNGKSGEVNLELEATTDKLKLKIKSGDETANIAVTEIDIITDAEIDSIISGLQ